MARYIAGTETRASSLSYGSGMKWIRLVLLQIYDMLVNAIFLVVFSIVLTAAIVLLVHLKPGAAGTFFISFFAVLMAAIVLKIGSRVICGGKGRMQRGIIQIPQRDRPPASNG